MNQQLQTWVAEQVAHFGPDDIDAGIEILRAHLHAINRGGDTDAA